MSQIGNTQNQVIKADILVVGGGAGGTAAAIQAARRGANQGMHVVIVSELPWLGGMLTSAGVSAPDGNELAAFQTGIWGAFLKALRLKHPQGLGNGWVSFFTYHPAVGAQVFADWVKELPNLEWISGQKPREVMKSGDRITGVRFDSLTVHATITLDGTELGDVLSLAEVPYRWGWETRDVWQEPSAPISLTDPNDPLYAITQRYPVQSPTWVVIMQDYGNQDAPLIAAPPQAPPQRSRQRSHQRSHQRSRQDSPDSLFAGAWNNYGDAETPAGEACLNYGRLPDNQFMINWPHQGNDYGVGLHRLIESDDARAEYGQEARWHSQSFARYIQTHIGRQYGLASDVFPKAASQTALPPSSISTDNVSPGGAFALMPYYRESRRLQGIQTVCERDILPVDDGQVAPLPVNEQGAVSAIAFGNYPNDHHYPGFEMPLEPKAIRWGGRWTGTPFTIPYEALVPQTADGLLVCEKNISVSHIANGATRLQPVVLGIGQAAGMAAALCVENRCDPRALIQPTERQHKTAKKADGQASKQAGNHDIKSLQIALLSDPTAPAAVIPLFNLPPEHPEWRSIQEHYLTHPEHYPPSGHHSFKAAPTAKISIPSQNTGCISIKGKFYCKGEGHYELRQETEKSLPKCILLLTVRSEITEFFITVSNGQQVHLLGIWNSAGKWLLCKQINTL